MVSYALKRIMIQFIRVQMSLEIHPYANRHTHNNTRTKEAGVVCRGRDIVARIRLHSLYNYLGLHLNRSARQNVVQFSKEKKEKNMC